MPPDPFLPAPMPVDQLRTLLNYDPATGIFRWNRGAVNRVAGKIAGCIQKKKGYAAIVINGTRYQAHRLAWYFVTGDWVGLIDHKNRIKSDNRFANLRLANYSQNCINNSHRVKTFKGVTSRRPNRWAAYIYANHRHIHLGTFDNPVAAALARDRAALRYFGEFAVLNFPARTAP